jgi:hypothetical protein
MRARREPEDHLQETSWLWSLAAYARSPGFVARSLRERGRAPIGRHLSVGARHARALLQHAPRLPLNFQAEFRPQHGG